MLFALKVPSNRLLDFQIVKYASYFLFQWCKLKRM